MWPLSNPWPYQVPDACARDTAHAPKLKSKKVDDLLMTNGIKCHLTDYGGGKIILPVAPSTSNSSSEYFCFVLFCFQITYFIRVSPVLFDNG